MRSSGFKQNPKEMAGDRVPQTRPSDERGCHIGALL